VKRKDVVMKTRNFISVLFVLFTMLACVVPGLGQPANLDMENLSTVIVSTANAAMTQTAAVASPIPAETALPLSEATEIPETTGPTGTLEELPNGSTKFTDEVGYVVVFPKGWLTLRPNSEEFDAAFAKAATKNETLHGQMEIDQAAYEPGFDRLYSYTLLPDIEKNSLFGATVLGLDSDDTTPIDEAFMGEFIDVMETSGIIPGFRTDTARPYENGNQVKMIEVGGIFSISDNQGGFIPFYVTSVFFKPTHGGVIMMLFTYLKDYKLQIYGDVMSVVESVELVGQ